MARNSVIKNALATAYAATAPYGGLFAADPGANGSAANELSGGNPLYGRKPLNWSAPQNGVITTQGATFDVPNGATVSFFGVCGGNTRGTADVMDSVSITNQTFASQGTYTVTATYIQN